MERQQQTWTCILYPCLPRWRHAIKWTGFVSTWTSVDCHAVWSSISSPLPPPPWLNSNHCALSVWPALLFALFHASLFLFPLFLSPHSFFPFYSAFFFDSSSFSRRQWTWRPGVCSSNKSQPWRVKAAYSHGVSHHPGSAQLHGRCCYGLCVSSSHTCTACTWSPKTHAKKPHTSHIYIWLHLVERDTLILNYDASLSLTHTPPHARVRKQQFLQYMTIVGLCNV